MDSIVSGLAIFVFLLVVFRLTGNRSLAQITVFDAVLMLIIAEAVQEAMISGDQSMMNALLLVVTLLGFDLLLALLGVRFPLVERLVDGTPIVLVYDGEPYRKVMLRSRVSENDVMEEARTQLGIERFEQIKHAVLERDGSITVIPRYVTWSVAPAPEVSPSSAARHGEAGGS